MLACLKEFNQIKNWMSRYYSVCFYQVLFPQDVLRFEDLFEVGVLMSYILSTSIFLMLGKKKICNKS